MWNCNVNTSGLRDSAYGHVGTPGSPASSPPTTAKSCYDIHDIKSDSDVIGKDQTSDFLYDILCHFVSTIVS